jgi:hypothetical protein
MLRAAGSFDPGAGLARFRAHDTWHGHVGIHLRHMKQSLNLQIHNALILVDICNLEDILLVPCLDAKILVALTCQRLELTLEPEKIGGNVPNLVLREGGWIAV